MQSRRGAANGQSGQGMVEYALILVLVSIVVIVVLLTMGQQINTVFSNVVVALGGSYPCSRTDHSGEPRTAAPRFITAEPNFHVPSKINSDQSRTQETPGDHA